MAMCFLVENCSGVLLYVSLGFRVKYFSKCLKLTVRNERVLDRGIKEVYPGCSTNICLVPWEWG